MSEYRVEIRVTPRPGLLDPEGNAILHALHSLDFGGVGDVRVGKVLYLDVAAGSESEAEETADAMCRKLLANPVTEDYAIDVLGESPTGKAAGAPGGAPGGTG